MIGNYVLGVVSCLGSCSLALADYKGNVLGHMQENDINQQCERLFPMLQGLLDQSAIDIKDVGKIVLAEGPGSWTGIRVGLSAVYGLQLLTKASLLAISTMDLLAWKIAKNLISLNHDTEYSEFAVVIPASRNQCYWQLYGLDRDVKSCKEDRFMIIEHDEITLQLIAKRETEVLSYANIDAVTMANYSNYSLQSLPMTDSIGFRTTLLPAAGADAISLLEVASGFPKPYTEAITMNYPDSLFKIEPRYLGLPNISC